MSEVNLNDIYELLSNINIKVNEIHSAIVNEKIDKLKLLPQRHNPTIDKLETLSNKIQIDIKHLNEIIEIKDNNILLNAKFPDDKESVKQQKAAIMILTAMYYCLDVDTISTSDLKEKLKWLGIKSLQMLSPYFKKIPELIEGFGKVGSKNFKYKIKYQGLEKAIDYFKEQYEIKMNQEVKNE